MSRRKTIYDKIDKEVQQMAEQMQPELTAPDFWNQLNKLIRNEKDYNKLTSDDIKEAYKKYRHYRVRYIRDFVIPSEKQLIDKLSNDNIPTLSFDDLTDALYSNFQYDETLLTRFNELFKYYIQRRDETIRQCERELMKVINTDNRGQNKKVPRGKTLPELFKLVPFKNMSNIVDKNKIWNYYISKYPPETKQHVKRPKKESIDLHDAFDFIYRNLILSGERFLNPNEFLHYIISFDETKNVSQEYKPLYNKYKERYFRYQQKIKQGQVLNENFRLAFPFKSKKKDYERNIKEGIFNKSVKFTEEEPDTKAKPLKNELSRPSFAPFPYSWEIDHLQYDKNHITYLFCLNVNTRFLYVIPVRDKSEQETKIAIETLINNEMEQFNHPVKNIRGDGDKGFQTLIKKFPKINFYFNSSPFTYHNKLIDAAMRTLRNALNNDRLWDGRHDKTIQELVKYYNYTTHRVTGYKPYEMHTNIELEWEYIRAKKEELNDIKKKQYIEGLHNYKHGDKLKLHLEYSKTNQLFDKRRRQFDVTGTFIEYIHGNCRVKLDSGKFIEVPVYFTRRVKEL